jgi:chaperone required for assembly of F1-ATPase
MKRFWTKAEAVPTDDGYAVELDGRRVKTPARRDLTLPTKRLADSVAAEWNDSGEEVDPRAMPLTGLANAAIDRISSNRAEFAAGLAKYGESDLLCYRAQRPASLVTLQSDEWDPLLHWAERHYGTEFTIAPGIMHTAQPEDATAKLRAELDRLDAFQLAGISPLVTIGGSLVTALAIFHHSVAPEDGWWVVSLDDRWQAEQWGDDAEASLALDSRRDDFLAGARFLSLLA